MSARSTTIVAAIDDSDFADLVLEHALALAGEDKNAEIHILGVLEVKRRELDDDHSTVLEEIETDLKRRVVAVIDALDGMSQGSLRIRVHARPGQQPAEQILELADEARADLIIVGRHGAGGSRGKRHGKVPAKVLDGARCPVLVLSPTDYGEQDISPEQCAKCVQIRRDSNGERWFCDEHSSDRPWRSTIVWSGITWRDEGVWF